MFLTIQQFSEKTGLPPSTLRFYDRKEMLVPKTRLENGYRAYVKEQIPDALLIHSLRNADISIEDIKKFIVVDDEHRNILITKWRQQIEHRLTSLNIAKKYLKGLNPKENSIHLIRWEEPQTFIWLKHTVKRKYHPFQEKMVTDCERLSRLGIKKSDSYFVRILDSIGDKIYGEVGFIIDPIQAPSLVKQLDENVYFEKLEPSLFATMECSIHNEFLCFQFIQLIRQFGFSPQGQKMEKYESPYHDQFQYLIPLMNLNNV